MGQNHLRILSILKGVDLCCIYDTDHDKAHRLGNQYGVMAVETLDQVFIQDPEACIICTPTSTHAQYIRLASQHVKNIFIEKPMAASLPEAQDILALSTQKSLNLQVVFIERFNPAVQQLKHVLDSSEKVISIDFTRTNKLSARITDVDVISDLMIHDIDLALYMNGPVKSVSAHGSVDGDMIDFSSAIITHLNGKFSRIQASRITEKKIRTIEATCKDIFVDCELLRKEITLSRQSQIHAKEGGVYRVSSIQENIEVKPQEALLLELQSFIASCQGQTNIINPTALDGLNAIKVCDAIQKEIYNDTIAA